MGSSWAIICGAIRSKFEFDMSLNAAISLRQEGLLEGIVVSTWHDGFRKYPSLRDELVKVGIIVVSVPDIKESGAGNSYRQHRLLDAALGLCPNGSAILKMRSDKCLHLLRLFRSVLRRGLTALANESPYTILQSRIAIISASLSLPFCHCDMVFFGQKEDLRSLIQIDLIYDWVFFPGTANAEIRWFSWPFLNHIPILRQYFEYFHCRRMSRFIIECYQEGQLEKIPDLIHDVLAANILMIFYNFEIVSEASEVLSLSVKDVFTGVDDTVSRIVPLTQTTHLVVYSDTLLGRLVGKEMRSDPSNEPLYAALERMQDNAYSRRHVKMGELHSIQRDYFADLPVGYSGDSLFRFATNIYQPNERSEVNSLLPVSSVVDESLNMDCQADAFAFIRAHCHDMPMEVICFRLAKEYEVGDWLPPDPQSRKYWLHQSAARKYRPAQTEYGRLMECEGDLNAAAEWYFRAAAMDDKEAQEALARLLRNHDITSVKQDWHHWQKLAERKNHAPV